MGYPVPPMQGFPPGAYGNPAFANQMMMGGRGAGRGGPMPMMPGMPPNMMGPNMGGRGQQFGRGGPRQMGGFPQQRPQAPSASPALDVNALNAAPPAQQKQMLGEALYPKIHEQQPELAGKITGMLLEMDNAELLDLTTDDAALRNKVDEAMRVYNDYLKSQGGEEAAPAANGSENVAPAAEAATEEKA
ncbi:hypothetical protein KCU98_g22964, partial [Aureobasidium melanogenum]